MSFTRVLQPAWLSSCNELLERVVHWRWRERLLRSASTCRIVCEDPRDPLAVQRRREDERKELKNGAFAPVLLELVR